MQKTHGYSARNLGTRRMGLGAFVAVAVGLGTGCQRDSGGGTDAAEIEQDMPMPASNLSSDADQTAAAPSPAIQAWMDRLTVDHTYDPATGFIVAEETITLPPLIADGPSLDEAVRDAGEQIVVVFATADRCAPCQQYKQDALNDEAVIARLTELGVVVTHVEVDQEPEAAERHLGSKAIPMTYALRHGTKLTELRGQRSADELLAWLDALPES